MVIISSWMPPMIPRWSQTPFLSFPSILCISVSKHYSYPTALVGSLSIPPIIPSFLGAGNASLGHILLLVHRALCQLFKKMHERVVSCFILGKMRATVWETAPQIALRNCSKKVAREGQYIFNFGKGGVHAHLSLQRFSASQEKLMSP